MKKILKYFVILLLTMVITGCGEDSYVPTSSTSDSTPKVEKGLYGNKYFNTKFGISISNLPVDDWTVRAFGKVGQGMLRKTETGFIPCYLLLLMEPVPADSFIGLNDEGYFEIDNNIPFIWVGVDYLKGGEFNTYKNLEDIKHYAAFYGYEIESKKPVYFGNASGYQAILIREGENFKYAITWFAKGEVHVRCELWAMKTEFEKHFSTYEMVLKNTTLMGK